MYNIKFIILMFFPIILFEKRETEFPNTSLLPKSLQEPGSQNSLQV